MRIPARVLLVCCMVLPGLMTGACTRVVGGVGVAAFPGTLASGVDVDAILLDQSRMQAITGGGEHLTIIPSMDGKSPVDIDTLAAKAPPQCRFVYAETATFGPDIEGFHKTTFQYPPQGGLISEGAAAYRDAGTAQRAFDVLVSTVEDCSSTSDGSVYVGDWYADAQSLHTRPGNCGRDYRLKSVVLLEVTFCGFPESVSSIVIANIAANIP